MSDMKSMWEGSLAVIVVIVGGEGGGTSLESSKLPTSWLDTSRCCTSIYGNRL